MSITKFYRMLSPTPYYIYNAWFCTINGRVIPGMYLKISSNQLWHCHFRCLLKWLFHCICWSMSVICNKCGAELPKLSILLEEIIYSFFKSRVLFWISYRSEFTSVFKLRYWFDFKGSRVVSADETEGSFCTEVWPVDFLTTLLENGLVIDPDEDTLRMCD